MIAHDPRQTRNAYHGQVKARRLEQAATLWTQMRAAGVRENTFLVLDFTHEASTLRDADALAGQLGESYHVDIFPASENGRWQVIGTTRPEGVFFSGEQLEAWAAIMSDVAQSHDCVFSSWSLEAPAISRTFLSERVRTALNDD